MSAVAVTGLGAVTPVGLSLEATCSALRAGIARMLPFEGWSDGGPKPPEDWVGGRVPLEWLAGEVRGDWPGHERWKMKPPKPHLLVSPGPERLSELGVPAAEEAWSDAGRPPGNVGLYLGLDDEDDGAQLAQDLSRVLAIRPAVMRQERHGRAAALAALHRASRHLREERVEIALVGGVDSRIRRTVLAGMEASGSLRTEANPTGVIPGEAAIFMVLERRATGGRARAWLTGSGVADEPTAGTSDPNRGDGLTKAFRLAREEAPAMDVRPLIVCDLNGDRYRALEWGLVSVRALGDLHPPPERPASAELWHAADCIGDAGAASGALSVAWAVTAMWKGYAHASRALVWGASDGALRASVVIARDLER